MDRLGGRGLLSRPDRLGGRGLLLVGQLVGGAVDPVRRDLGSGRGGGGRGGRGGGVPAHEGVGGLRQ
ncbi:MAG TPA: hypothetical protein ENI86_14980, partial [Acidimicrobiales bacterium]|nr:hypothetical protein [Acidimicrobiales bacterium]